MFSTQEYCDLHKGHYELYFVSYKQGNTSSKQVTEANIHGIMSSINGFMTSIKDTMRWI